jgi:hypothetical protein
MFAKIKNNKVIEWPIQNIAALFPNTSFPSPMTDDSLPNGYVSVGVIPAPQPGANQKVIPGQPIKQNDKWVQSWDIVDMTSDEIVERNNIKVNEVKFMRDRLLVESDWTQVADAPVDKAAWGLYRQQLRDITKQQSFPFDIIWPIQPSK